MTRVVINGGGRFVGYAYTNTVLEPGQSIVDIEQDDIQILQAGGQVKSMQATLDANRAFRDNPRMTSVLGLGAGEELTGNLLRNWAQDLTRQEQRVARQLNTLWRAVLGDVDPRIVEPGDPDSGPE